MRCRLPIATALPVTLLLLGVFAAGCGGPALFQIDDQKSWREMCPPDSEESRELLLYGDCGYRVRALTAEAACAAGDHSGCAMASFTRIHEDSPVHDRERAIELAEMGCEQGEQSACLALSYALETDGTPFEIGRSYNLLKETCLDGMGMSCHVFGEYYEREHNTARGRRLAAGYFKKACDNEFAAGCYDFARVYEEGVGVSRNEHRARELYARACELDHREACLKIDRTPSNRADEMFLSYIGLTYSDFVDMAMTSCTNGFRHACSLAGRLIERGEISGRYVATDEKVVDIFETGCEAGSAESCHFLARKVRLGEGSEANTQRAADLAKKGCELGLNNACTRYRDYRYRLFDAKAAAKWANRCQTGDGEACYLSGQSYMYGANFDPDLERGVALLEEGCSADHADSCEVLGLMFSGGKLVDEDIARANARLTKGCELGADDACVELGRHYDEEVGVTKDASEAHRLYMLGCERGHAFGCAQAGAMFQNGEGVEKNEEQARTLISKGCGQGYVTSCTNLGIMFQEGYGGEEDDELARLLFRRSCEQDDGRGCYLYGEMLESGEGADDDSGDPEPIEAADHYEMACLVGHGQGCAELARLHREGKGVRKDIEKATMLEEKACMEGHQESCPEAPTTSNDEQS